MKDWLIKKLGGYTQDHMDYIEDENEDLRWELAKAEKTIEELASLVPAPVVPKKRGRPRKIV